MKKNKYNANNSELTQQDFRKKNMLVTVLVSS